MNHCKLQFNSESLTSICVTKIIFNLFNYDVIRTCFYHTHYNYQDSCFSYIFENNSKLISIATFVNLNMINLLKYISVLLHPVLQYTIDELDLKLLFSYHHNDRIGSCAKIHTKLFFKYFKKLENIKTEEEKNKFILVNPMINCFICNEKCYPDKFNKVIPDYINKI